MWIILCHNPGTESQRRWAGFNLDPTTICFTPTTQISMSGLPEQTSVPVQPAVLSQTRHRHRREYFTRVRLRAPAQFLRYQSTVGGNTSGIQRCGELRAADGHTRHHWARMSKAELQGKGFALSRYTCMSYFTN